MFVVFDKDDNVVGCYENKGIVVELISNGKGCTYSEHKLCKDEYLHTIPNSSQLDRYLRENKLLNGNIYNTKEGDTVYASMISPNGTVLVPFKVAEVRVGTISDGSIIRPSNYLVVYKFNPTTGDFNDYLHNNDLHSWYVKSEVTKFVLSD